MQYHVCDKISIIKLAFTLAEVLITLGIIGVVSALTMPSLLTKHQEKTAIVQLKKSYSVLEQAFTRAVNDLGTVDNWCSQDDLYDNCSDIMLANIKPYLNTVKDCPKLASATPKCFPVYKFFYNTTSWNSSYNIEGWGPSMILNDGSVFLIKAGNGDGYKSAWCSSEKNKAGNRYNGPCGYIYIDINGHKNPNQGGRDVFSFKIFKDGIVPSGVAEDTVWTESFAEKCKREYLRNNNYQLVNCAAWAIINENMDYLRCDDLSWNGKKSCK